MKKVLSLVLAALMLLSALPFFAYADDKPVKNVIYMIGDGMGENHLEWTKKELGVTLTMDSMPYKGYRITDSLSGLTDSAAGGTALSCGLLAFNSNVGTCSISIGSVGVVIANYENLCEASQRMGKKTGVVTSDSTTGATPAAFSAHTAARGEASKISAQQLECGLDLLWTAADGIITEESATKAGWQFVDSMDEIYNLEPGSKSLAQFSGKIQYKTGNEDDAPLSELTNEAIKQLDNDENGFFLMIEGAHIDKYSHSNIKEDMMKSLVEFDKAVENALAFAEEDGETIVVVTADHETGGITPDGDSYKFTKGSHSRANVPLRVYGTDVIVGNGETVKNVTVARNVSKLIGNESPFPSYSFAPNILGSIFKALFSLFKK